MGKIGGFEAYRLLPEFVHAAESVQVALPEPAPGGRGRATRDSGTCFVDVGEKSFLYGI